MTTTITDLKLYTLKSVCSLWPHRGYRYDGMHVWWLVWDRPDPIGDYSALLDETTEYQSEDGRTRVTGHELADELFTAGEASLFAEYLKSTHDEDVTLVEVSLPIAVRDEHGNEQWSLGQSPFGGGVDMYCMWREDGYSLPFKVGGYYDVNSDGQDLVAVSRSVQCPHHGLEEIAVSPCDPINIRPAASASPGPWSAAPF